MLCILLSLLAGEYWTPVCECVLLVLFILQPFLVLVETLSEQPAHIAVHLHPFSVSPDAGADGDWCDRELRQDQREIFSEYITFQSV